MLVEALELLVGGRADPTDRAARRHRGPRRRPLRRRRRPSSSSPASCRPTGGRGRTSTVGRPPSAALADATAGLVDLHGQHAHQSLLGAATQREALDRFGARRPGAAAGGPCPAHRARRRAGDARRRRARSGPGRSTCCASRSTSSPRPASTTRTRSAGSSCSRTPSPTPSGHREAGAAAHEALADDGGARDALAAAAAALERPRAVRRRRRPAGGAARRARRRDRRGARRRRGRSRRTRARLAEVRQRRQLLRDLCRKYGDDVAEVIAYGERRRPPARRAGGLRAARGRRSTPSAPRRGRRRAARPPTAVGRARRAAAPRWPRPSRHGCASSPCPTPTVAVEVGEHPTTPGDDVQFLLAGQPGRAAAAAHARSRPAASWPGRCSPCGSCSATSDDDAAATLVFDEVDAGIGGAAATAVGRALAEVGRRPPGARRHPPRPGGRRRRRRRWPSPSRSPAASRRRRRRSSTATTVSTRWPGCSPARRAARPPAATLELLSCPAAADAVR